MAMTLLGSSTIPDNVLCSFFLIPALLLALLLWQLLTKRHKHSLLPPGPPALPIIGNLHQLSGHRPHLSLHRLAQKHGPIIHLRLGQVPAVVISSAELAKQAAKAHDLALSNRPITYSWKHYYDYSDIVMAPYGPYWRGVRKLCAHELFSSKRVQSFGHVQQEEVARLVGRIGLFYPEPVNLSERLALYANDVICKTAFGRIFSEDGDLYHRHGFQDMLEEFQVLFSGFCVGDLFPSLEWINIITGTKGRLVRIFNRFDVLLDELIEEHQLVLNKATSKETNFVHI